MPRPAHPARPLFGLDRLTNRPALAPLRVRAFRYQWPADLATAWALEMETLILGWYVLVESGSVVMLTLFGALMYGGTLLSPAVGTLGDRIGLRRLLAGMRVTYALLAAVVLLLAVTGQLSPAPVLVLALLVGLVKPSDIGMRTALVGATVPASQLVAAMGLSRTTQDSARIGGALAGAGFMASLGMVGAYVAITALYLLAAVLTWRSGAPAALPRGVPADGPAPADAAPRAAPAGSAPAASAWQDLKEGLGHVWHTPRLRAAMVVAALANLCAFPLTGGLMPYVARDVFGLDQQGLGWLVASYASGALAGSLVMGAFGARLPAAHTMLLSCALWFVALMGLALPVGVGVAQALLMAAGLLQSLGMLALSLILLRTCEERLRGRVMGVRMLAIYTLPLGLLAAGMLIPRVGFRALVLGYGTLGLLALAAITLAWRRELLPRAARANAV